MNRKYWSWLLAAALVVPLSVVAAGDGAVGNVLIKVTMIDDGAEGAESGKTYELLTMEDQRTELLAGWRVPIATTDSTEGEASVTSYTYQNVGVTIQLETMMIGEKQVRIKGQIELSDVEREADVVGATPMIGTFQHQFQIMLTRGTPVTVARCPKRGQGTLTILVEADVQG